MSNRFDIPLNRPLSANTAAMYRQRISAMFKHLGAFDPTGAGVSMAALREFLDRQEPYRSDYVTALVAFAAPGTTWVDELRNRRGRIGRTPVEIQDFMGYLQREGLTPATAAAYASAIQSVANRLDAPLSLPIPDSWTMLDYSPGVVARIGAAVTYWNTYVAASDRDGTTAAQSPTLAELMRHVTFRKIPVPRLVELRWDDLQVTTKEARDGIEHWTEVRFAISRGPECWNHYDVSPAAPRGELVRLYRLDRHYADLLRVHRLWAAPQVPYDPVFPAHPGSSVPMTARTLRKFATGA